MYVGYPDAIVYPIPSKWRKLMPGILKTALIVFAAVVFNISAENSLKKTVAVIPFKTIGVSAADADNLLRKINEAFTSVPEIDLIPMDKVFAGFNNSSIVKDSLCRNVICAIAVANFLRANYAFVGNFYKIDNTYTLSISAVKPQINETVWTKDYSSKEDINDFIKKISENTVIDARNAVFTEQKLADIPVETNIDTTEETAIPQVVDNTIESEENPAAEKKQQTEVVSVEDNVSIKETTASEPKVANYGTVQGLTVGVVGRYVLNEPGFTESEWGVDVFCLVPTTKVGQARFKFALPMSTADTMMEGSTYKQNKDFFFTLEHEWGLKNIGITIGLGYMYLDNFQKSDTVHNYSSDQVNTYNFKTSHRANWVFGIRAGKPNRGFRGRISYPLTFGEETNAFVEYSAFGMFGNSRVKGGIGLQGAAKRRVGKLSSTYMISSSSYYGSSYYSDSTRNETEYYFMGPAGKIAFLIGQHSSVTIGLDFMGIFIPDIFNNDDEWTPNVLLGYTFSFGKLTNPETYDGKF
jgi:hypothetical protein